MSLLKSLSLPTPKNAPAAAAPALASAASAWLDARRVAGERLAALRAAVRAASDEEPDALRAQIDTGLARLDGLLDLADPSLARMLQDGDAAAAKAAVGRVAAAVRGEALIAHVDANPFGVKTELRALFADALGQASKALA